MYPCAGMLSVVIVNSRYLLFTKFRKPTTGQKNIPNSSIAKKTGDCLFVTLPDNRQTSGLRCRVEAVEY